MIQPLYRKALATGNAGFGNYKLLKMTYSQESLNNRTLFNWIMNDLKLQETEIYNSELEFFIFSCEPFGFSFPHKSELKKRSDHYLARQFSKRNIARDKFVAILNEVSHLQKNNMRSFFIEKMNTLYSEMQPWCIKVDGIDNLRKILDNYMVGYNVGWDGDQIGNTSDKLFYIQLWIELDTNNISAYKKNYRL